MGETLLTALLSYIGTSIDHIIVLILLFSQTQHRKRDDLEVVGGVFAGFTLIILISLLARFGLQFVRQDWLGWLGLIPILLGVRVLFRPVDDETKAEEKITSTYARHPSQFGTVFFLMLAFGGDNLGVYIPLFASVSGRQLVLILLVYYSLSAVMLVAAYRISEVKQINRFIERYERWIVALVFILLGLYIMWENGLNVF
ncbi:Cadmium resistance protein [Alkalibacterium sp. AK22]|uniref:cadmium resistance transporter n=1 Tax=Alkalibacterium sp. AK22 TaxID=1229520 RepID=UPI00044BCB5E|nr:cadmium resistance transporter [Alkalibacterium sp. AK22]EXJ24391.1 Cadmium resistance protein [Alkalibacterium sp. AK22]